MKKYQIIYADPPWDYKVWEKKAGTRPWHYPRMSTEDIKSLPIVKLTDRDCFLFLWSTSPNLKEAMDVIDAWEFAYKTVAFNWVKLNNNMGFFMGMGHYTRLNAEYCLLATKGHPRRVNADVPQIIATPRMAHSRKPDEIVRGRILRLCGDLPRIELFARRKIEGWDCWGNEVESDIEL
jgi:N6-adenosine-specific RNA methylase IME4